MVLEHVDKNSPIEKAGFQPGDILLHWARGDLSGDFDSPFDFYNLEAEQAPRGPVTIEGFRGITKRVWVVEQGDWGAAGRPNLAEPFLSSYLEAEAMAKAGRVAEAVERYRADAIKARQVPCKWLSSWFLFHAGKVLQKEQELDETDRAYQDAVREAEARDAGSAVRAWLFTAWAWAYGYQGDWAGGEKYHKQALAEWRKLGDDSMNVAHSLQYLGMTARHQGNLPAAEEYYRQALAIQEKLAPGSLAVAANLNNLGTTFHERGDFVGAERYYRQALAIEEKLSPGSWNFAHDVRNLGSLSEDRGDLAMAKRYYQRALEAFQDLDHNGASTAGVLTKLGGISLSQGDLTKAETYLEQSVSINKDVALRRLYMGSALTGLGDVARIRKEFDKAEGYYQQAFTALEQKHPPEINNVATLLNRLGGLELERNNLMRASKYYDQAKELWGKLAPGSAGHAESLAGLAQTMLRRQRSEAAAQLYEQALNALENQTVHLGGSDEIRSGFRAQYSNYYKDYIDLLVTQKKSDHAFDVLERLRARSLLEDLAPARMDIRKGVDPALGERERLLRESVNAESSRRAQLLNGKHSEGQVSALDKEINDLLTQHKEVESEIRASSPAYAALTQPQPLSTKDVQQQLLDADTLLLEYSLGQERSYVFAVTSTSLAVYELPKRAEIETAARDVYALLTASKSKLHGESNLQRKRRLSKAETEYEEAAAGLSHMVLGPVAYELKGKRLLIVSDGALQYIPFALLPVPKRSASHPTIPLVAEHEIVNLPSASVLAVLRQEELRRKPSTNAIAILADPVFADRDDRVQRASANGKDAGIPANAQHPNSSWDLSDTSDETDLDRSAKETGISNDGMFPRLPFTRREAEAIYSVAGKSSALEALDFDASKATALSPKLKDYRIIHFATHGLLNNDHPELSGLVFSLVDKQGHAEGLMGLTRGFMYAGAPRVVASLWKVDDEATAALMKKFYEGMLRDHQTPAQALRLAQQWMRTQKAWQSPYYWADFVLQGEWR